MRAMLIENPGEEGRLVLRDLPAPIPGEGEVLIRVRAAGLNRADLFQRKGKYPPPPGAPDIPGLEVAGEVAALGKGVKTFKEGDTICALLEGGGYAEYAVAKAGLALPFPAFPNPQSLIPNPFVVAASLPEALCTVWLNLFMEAGLKPGETLLAHGGASGIGVFAIQMAKAFGARVLVTAGSAEKCAFCEQLGAEKAINYKTQDFVEVVKAAGGADVILDIVGGDYIEKNFRAARLGGRIQLLSFIRGAKAQVDFAPLFMKDVRLSGSRLRAKPLAVKEEISARLREKLWPKLEAGEIRPVIDSTYPLEQAEAAQNRMEANLHIGKIVLSV